MAQKYHIELFDNKRHDIKEFNCGIEGLDKYLKEQAGQETRKKITAVYIIREKSSDKVIGYYTLNSYSIELTNLPENITKKLPKYKVLPTILIGRLAADSKYQGKRIGEYILLDALNRSYNLSKQVGSFAVIVESKDQKSRRFYEKYGFIKSINQELKLYLPMGTIKKLIDHQ